VSPVELLKRAVRRTPLVRDVARAAMRRLAARQAKSFRSGDYWEQRYARGRNSGIGSYSRLAEFKAEVLNAFVRDRRVRSVVEFGCGDGAQLRLARYPDYVGVDVSPTVLAATAAMFAGDPTKRFLHTDAVTPELRAELSLSLDVVYHLVEDAVFERYMAQLFDAATRFVIVYSSNAERPSESAHVRHRRFTDWVERNRPEFEQIGFVPNRFPEQPGDPETSFADFYLFARRDASSQA
jgi:SAM-dependent methyltransferase